MALKDDILEYLLAHPGDNISGQALAGMFGVSRSAIWKAVNALKNDGWEISSGTNRGYQLSPQSDKLSAARVSSLMGDRSVPVYVFDTIDSTNSEAKRRAAAGERSFLVIADCQTGGRGRRGKSFFSPPGSGLYMSLALSPDWDISDSVNITSYAAVCTAKAIEKLCSVHCGIKWVNDVYVGRRKVCGILTEAVTDFETGHVTSVVVGIGINLLPSAVPPELRDIVGFIGCEGVRNALAAEICLSLLEYAPGDMSYMDEYRRLSVVLGRTVSYVSSGQIRSGTAVDIDDSGGLVVDLGGRREILRSGEISLEHIDGIK